MDNVSPSLAEVFPLYRQGDARWSHDHLGYADAGYDSTLGKYGCAITSLAMLITFYGQAITPAELNRDLVARKGFRFDESRNLVDWPKLVTLYPIFSNIKRYNFQARDPNREEMAELSASLGSGRPVILKVDGIPQTPQLDQHFVVAVDQLESTTRVADPYTGQFQPLSHFYQRNKLHRQNEPAAIWAMLFFTPRLS